MSEIKVGVMFFSATGGGKRVATDIAHYFGNNSTLIDITHQLNKTIDAPVCDILFFILPVYSQLCPAPLKKFIKKLQFRGAVVPCVLFGGVSAGKALKQVCNIFKSKGCVVLAGAELASPHFYFDCHNFDKTPLKDSKHTHQLCKMAVLRLKQKTHLKSVPVRHFNPFSLFMPKLRAQLGVKLKVLDKSLCKKCLMCKTICPFKAIKINRAGGKCQRCGSCVRGCKNNNKRLVLSPIVHKYLKKHISLTDDTKIY